MSASQPSTFYVKVTGQIEMGNVIDSDEIYVHYFYHYGQDWKIVRGIEEGTSQRTRRSEDERNIFVWNFPFDVTFKSTNPYGWPQIVIVLNGDAFIGNDVVRGYTACHLPIQPGIINKKLKTFVPESATTLQKFVSWMSGSRPEFVNPQTIAQEKGRAVTRVRSQGVVSVQFNSIFKDFTKLGYNCGHSSMPGTANKTMSSIISDELANTEDTQSTDEGQLRKLFDPTKPTTSKQDEHYYSDTVS